MDGELSDEITGSMEIVPHEVAGVECDGCIIAVAEGSSVELRCNECGAVVGVVQLNILQGLLGMESAEATCPHCGKMNTFPGFSSVKAYVCSECGKSVEPDRTGGASVTTEIHDETCTWYEFSDGREPMAVLPCSRCRRHPDVDEDGVYCPLCRNRSPVRSDDLEQVILAWNEMVGGKD